LRVIDNYIRILEKIKLLAWTLRVSKFSYE
jgi:hypothetical protein